MPAKKNSRKRTPALTVRIAALALLGCAAVTGLSLASVTRDPLTEGWILLLRRLFGWGVYAIPVALGAVGFWLLLQSLGREPGLQWGRTLGATLLSVACVTAIHLLSFPEDAQQLAAEGGGGGYVGWFVSQALTVTVGSIGAYVTLAAMGIVGAIMLFGVSIVQMGAYLRRASMGLRNLRRHHYPKLKIRRASKDEGVASRVAEKVSDLLRPSPIEEEAPQKRDTLPVPRIIVGGKEWNLPSVENILLENIGQELSETEIKRKLRIIEDTLHSFGVPAKVVEVNQGPTVTQFGVEPGYVERKGRDGKITRAKVKVSKIDALAKDLSLALAAAPIRIEAPVPGRSIIGIEVPNDEVSLVSLRGVMESDEFRQETSKLKVALGQDVSGAPVVADLGKMPHLLIAGATGSGKSVCINSIVTCLLFNNTPDDLRLLMIDPKMVELVNFNGIPHLLSPVVVEIEGVVGTLKWVLREMDRRYKLLSRAQARNIDHYNQKLLPQGERPLPYIVVVVDELADLMMVAPDQVESSLCRLAQMSRATGIHLIIATQRPSVDVVTGLIKANFPARISFAVTSHTDSRVVLDMAGAEKLLGRGDMLYMASDSSTAVRLQGCFVSDKELEKLVLFWKGLEVPREAAKEELVQQQPLWPELAAVPEEKDEQEDELLEEAIEVVRREKRASISLLQRRLRIGYVRAARLIDTLEDKGIVGPAAGAGRSRKVLEMEEEVPWPTL
ncbi:MAG: cell division protein FtsK [Chloroflexi bacterium B3_Chlor]|nr:MAG: cell division protein FtsK [Chloroflexi bacterium B3_Chlor]